MVRGTLRGFNYTSGLAKPRLYMCILAREEFKKLLEGFGLSVSEFVIVLTTETGGAA